MEHAGWNATTVRDIVPDEVRALRQQCAGDLAVGGPQIASQLLPYDYLIAEFHVNVLRYARDAAG